MAYNFDRTPNRRIPGVANKWTFYPNDVLPMWVADMDFPAPKPILDELRAAVNQGVLGYEIASNALAGDRREAHGPLVPLEGQAGSGRAGDWHRERIQRCSPRLRFSEKRISHPAAGVQRIP